MYLYEAFKALLKGKLAGRSVRELERSLGCFEGLYPEIRILIGAAYIEGIGGVIDQVKAIGLEEIAAKAISMYQETRIPALIDAVVDQYYLQKQIDVVRGMSFAERMYTEPLMNLELSLIHI